MRVTGADRGVATKQSSIGKMPLGVSPNGNGFPLMLSTHSKRDMCTTEILKSVVRNSYLLRMAPVRPM